VNVIMNLWFLATQSWLYQLQRLVNATLHVRVIMYSGLKRMGVEVITAYVKALTWHSPERSKKTTKLIAKIVSVQSEI
jgi:hypothetical protein